MERTTRITLLALSMLLLAHASLAQNWKGKGRLQGQVLDPEGDPYPGARIHLWFNGTEGLGPEEIVTDKKGRWSYLGLAGGSWTIRIVSEEYMISEGSTQVKEFGPPGQPIRIELKKPSVDPKVAKVSELLDRGNTFLQEGKLLEARAAYDEALPDVPEDSRASLFRALAQTWSEENSDKAIDYLQQSLALAPDDTLTLKLLINVLLEAGREDEAKPLIARLPAEEKLDIATRLNLGIDLYNQGEMDGALEHFELAIQDYPEEADPYFYRGMVRMGRDLKAEATADFEKFLTLAPPEAPQIQDVKQFLEYLKQ